MTPAAVCVPWHPVATSKRFVSGGIVGLLVVCALTACSKTASGTTSVLHCPVSTANFALSLVSTRGGAKSPLAAAVAISGAEMAGMPGFTLPTTHWVVVRQQSGTASVRSGSFQLHAIKATDGTWKIDSGYHCLDPTGPPHGSSTAPPMVPVYTTALAVPDVRQEQVTSLWKGPSR